MFFSHFSRVFKQILGNSDKGGTKDFLGVSFALCLLQVAVGFQQCIRIQ